MDDLRGISNFDEKDYKMRRIEARRITPAKVGLKPNVPWEAQKSVS